MTESKKPRIGAFGLALDLLLRPPQALERLLSKNGALTDAAKVYAAYLAATVAFYTLKPAGFPPLPAGAPAMHSGGGLGFWISVHAWNPVFTVVGIAMVGWFAWLLKGGRLALRLPAAVCCGFLPLFLILGYSNTGMPKWGFALLWLVLILAAVPGFRAQPAAVWKPLCGLFLAVNAISLALLPLFAGALFLKSPIAYHIVEIAALFWTLGLAAYGVSRLAGISAARAFCAIFLSTLCQVFFIFSLHLLGIIPKDALKALMTV